MGMKPVILPNKLGRGNTIAIIAPSEPPLKMDIFKARKLLEKRGYKVVLGKNIFKKIGQYTAGTPLERAKDFNWAFKTKYVKAVLMAEGGYSSDQILDYINFRLIKNNPKIFIGFSDATALQGALLVKSNLATFHGPVATGLPESSKYTLDNMFQTLSGKKTKIEPFSKWQVLREGKGEGYLMGGNLETLTALMGTKYDPFPAYHEIPKIFFWEDWNAWFSTIIRGLYHLKNAGVFESCQGMIVGKLTKCRETEYPGLADIREYIKEITAEYRFPVIYGVDFGHSVPKITIPMGVKAKIDTKNLSIKFAKSVK